jgi:hypothetical protein
MTAHTLRGFQAREFKLSTTLNHFRDEGSIPFTRSIQNQALTTKRK